MNKVDTHFSVESPGSQMKMKLVFILLGLCGPPSGTPTSLHAAPL